MALLAFNDSFSRHCSPNDHRRCFQFLGKLDSLENYDVGGVGGGFKFNKCSAGLKLTIRSCFEDSRRTRDRKARAFTPHSARDFEILGSNESQKMAKSAIDTSGACERRSPLDFPLNPLPEKIAVAVDVDEGLRCDCQIPRCIRHGIWNCSRDEADICVHEFFKTPYFKKGIHPIPGLGRM